MQMEYILCFYRATLCVCRSIRPSRRYCIKTARCRITQIPPYDSPGTLVFRFQKSRRNSNKITPTGAPNRGEVDLNGDFRPLFRYISETCKIETVTIKR